MKNKEIAIDILKSAWENQEFDKLEQQISKDMILHIREKSNKINVEGLITIIQKWKSIFPDLHYQILQVVSEEEIVAVNCILKGTPVKPWRSFKPSDKSIAVPHSFFFRFEQNRLVEVWEINDFSVIDRQLGEEDRTELS